MRTADWFAQGLHSKAPRRIKPSIAAAVIILQYPHTGTIQGKLRSNDRRKWPIKDLAAAVSWHFTGMLIRDCKRSCLSPRFSPNS